MPVLKTAMFTDWLKHSVNMATSVQRSIQFQSALQLGNFNTFSILEMKYGVFFWIENHLFSNTERSSLTLSEARKAKLQRNFLINWFPLFFKELMIFKKSNYLRLVFNPKMRSHLPMGCYTETSHPFKPLRMLRIIWRNSTVDHWQLIFQPLRWAYIIFINILLWHLSLIYSI